MRDTMLLALLFAVLFSSQVLATKYDFDSNKQNPELHDGRTRAVDELEAIVNDPMLKRRAKNVIFFLGDGMGVSTLTGARMLKGQLAGKNGEEALLSFEESFLDSAVFKTYSADYQTTDSAAAGICIRGVLEKIFFKFIKTVKKIMCSITAIMKRQKISFCVCR